TVRLIRAMRNLQNKSIRLRSDNREHLFCTPDYADIADRETGMESCLSKSAQIRGSIFSTGGDAWLKIDIEPPPLMRQIPKTELSPDNGCIIDMKWKLGPLGYHASGAGKVNIEPTQEAIRLPELVLYDHI